MICALVFAFACTKPAPTVTPEELEAIELRKRTAKNTEAALLKNGLDVKITLEGPKLDTMKSECKDFNRPTLYPIVSDNETKNNLQEKGFKKLIFTDGKQAWTFNLESPDEWQNELNAPVSIN